MERRGAGRGEGGGGGRLRKGVEANRSARRQ